MRSIVLLTISCLLLLATDLYAQEVRLDKCRLEPVQVAMSIEKLRGKEAVRVVKDAAVPSLTSLCEDRGG